MLNSPLNIAARTAPTLAAFAWKGRAYLVIRIDGGDYICSELYGDRHVVMAVEPAGEKFPSPLSIEARYALAYAKLDREAAAMERRTRRALNRRVNLGR